MINSMQLVLNYNIELAEIADLTFPQLYEKRRRDSIFAAVMKDGETYYAIRDHLGIVPLFYRKINNDYLFATNLDELLSTRLANSELTINKSGLGIYLGIGTSKVWPLFNQIGIVPPGAVLKMTQGKTSPVLVYQYEIKPRQISLLQPQIKLINEFSQLFIQGLKRQIKSESVGLYLSGGVDSGLIGLYLKKLGLSISTFSSATGGKDSTEIPFIEKNLDHIKPEKNYRDYLKDNYQELSQNMADLYRLPHGNPTALAIQSLWLNTPITEQKQIFVGQNCDVILNAMDNDHFFTFSYLIPKQLRAGLGLSINSMAAKYTRSQTGGLANLSPFDFDQLYGKSNLNNFQLISLAGIYVGRTPVDGESLAQPAINKNIIISNPYYDLDLVEFCLGLRLTHKSQFSKNWKLLSIDKRIIRELALLHNYPRDLVYRKKGFTVPRGKSLSEPPGRARYFNSLPTKMIGVVCRTPSQRFAAGALQKYLFSRGLRHLLNQLID